MDIAKNKKKINGKRIALVLGSAIILAIVSTKFWASTQNISLSIDSIKVQKSRVVFGDLKVKVTAYGKILSNSINVISANVNGVVANTYVKSGEQVEIGQILVELINIELNYVVDEVQWNLDELESQRRELLLGNKTRIIDAELALFKTEKELNINELQLTAQKKLIELHNVVPKITHEETKLNNIMLKRQFSLEKEKLVHLKQQMIARSEANIAKINKNKKILARAQERVAALTIRAKFSGYIDEFNVDLGQNLIKGQKVAKVIGNNGFYAELKVPEYNVSQIAVDQSVLIETRDKMVKGKVTRISPSVEEGNVKVDVSFNNAESPLLRLEEAVEGQIIIKNIPDTLYVKKPIYAKINLTTIAYKKITATNQYKRSKVSFGSLSDNLIEIRGGVKVGDILITSDISAFSGHDFITVN